MLENNRNSMIKLDLRKWSFFIISDLYPRNFYTDRKQRWNDQQIVVDDSFERMSGYKYFGIVDHDEIILPYRRWTIKQMLVNRKSCLFDKRAERPPFPQLAKVYTVKHVLRGHSKRRPKIGFKDPLLLNAGQKYCRMLQESILQYFRPGTFDLH